MRKRLLVVFATGLSLLFGAGVAMANPHVNTKGDRLYTGTFASDCYKCHENSDKHTTGPHGGYTVSTAKCNTCHDVHIGENSEKGDSMGLAGQYNEQLLPGQSLTAACNYCHDLTGSKDGPYNMTGGMTPGSAHRVIDLNGPKPNGTGGWKWDTGLGAYGTWSYTDTQGHPNDNSVGQTGSINSIPGGSFSDGWEGFIRTYENRMDNDYSDGAQGRLSGSYFTCDSCHTPHGVNTVNPYLGESEVKVTTDETVVSVYGNQVMYMTTRLLKQHPNGSDGDQYYTQAVTEYSSQWCLGCHNGRDALGSDDHNHPVNETLPGYTFLADYVYANQGLDIKLTTISKNVYSIEVPKSNDPRKNTQYALAPTDELVLKDDRPDGHKEYSDFKVVGSEGQSLDLNGPACQQCHGSARDVEQAFSLNNPARRSFPHISEYKALLVENDNDDFCTNCHAPSMLP